MKLAAQADRGHLLVGSLLAVGALAATVGTIALALPALALLAFFFGVWGGIELGRYVERWLARRD
jgi:uncharacterized membrane protein YiaA